MSSDTPSRRAVGELATTRLAKNTAAGSCSGTPAAITGQSGHLTTSVRTAVMRWRPATDERLRALRRWPHLRPLRATTVPPGGDEPRPVVQSLRSAPAALA